MFQKILRRMRSWGRSPARNPATATPAPAPAEARPEGSAGAVTSAVEGRAPSVHPAAPPPPPDPEVATAIWNELRVRIRELRARFSHEADGTDVDSLLDGIARPGAVIRQPPVAAQAVLSLSRRRNYGLNEMTELFERDPAMSQALLKHGNSAWFAGLSPEPLLSIKATIQRVGTKGVHATVMHYMLQGELSRPGGGLDRPARMVWEHMVRTAPLARGLAPFFRADPEDAFTLGLLHDVGKLVFFDRVATERKRLRKDVRLPDGFVTAALNVLHEPLGGLAALEWGMDQRSARIIATHHRWGDHPVDEPLSQVIYLAEAVDIARQRDEEVELELVWEEGDLDGPWEPVAAWLVAHAEEQEEAERAHKRKSALSR